MNDWLKPKDVAKLMGFSLNTVYTLIHQGRIPSSRVGPLNGRHRVKASDVEAYLEASRARQGGDLPQQGDGVLRIPNRHF